jgi:hypothetical protein
MPRVMSPEIISQIPISQASSFGWTIITIPKIMLRIAWETWMVIDVFSFFPL